MLRHHRRLDDLLPARTLFTCRFQFLRPTGSDKDSIRFGSVLLYFEGYRIYLQQHIDFSNQNKILSIQIIIWSQVLLALLSLVIECEKSFPQFSTLSSLSHVKEEANRNY